MIYSAKEAIVNPTKKFIALIFWYFCIKAKYEVRLSENEIDMNKFKDDRLFNLLGERYR